MPDDELERLRALFEHAHDPEKMNVFRRALRRIKHAFNHDLERPEPEAPKKKEAA